MKVGRLKEFAQGSTSRDPIELTISILQYLKTDLAENFRRISDGFASLTFRENFDSFIVTVAIPAASELPIRNQLRGGVTPSQRLIVRGNDASADVVDGDTPWDSKFVYLKNLHGAKTALVTVVFLR